MSSVCPICGKKVGGLTGLPKPFSDAIESGIQWDMPVECFKGKY